MKGWAQYASPAGTSWGRSTAPKVTFAAKVAAAKASPSRSLRTRATAMKSAAEPIANQTRAGYIERENGSLRVTRKGLLQVDSLLWEYFEPQHRAVRYT